jgi:hypothetical protein
MAVYIWGGRGKGVPYHAHMAYWGRGGIAPLLLNLSTGRGLVAGKTLSEIKN